jgi:hypothetical protein
LTGRSASLPAEGFSRSDSAIAAEVLMNIVG